MPNPLHEIRQVLDLERKILDREDEILERLPKALTHSVANVFSGDEMADNVLVFNVGDTAVDTLTPRLADGVTPSGGVVSGVSVTFSDPSATFVLNPDNTVTFTGVAASTGPVNGSVAFTITDTDGVVSQWNVAFTVTTNSVVTPPPPPAQLTQSVANVFVVTPAGVPAANATRGPSVLSVPKHPVNE